MTVNNELLASPPICSLQTEIPIRTIGGKNECFQNTNQVTEIRRLGRAVYPRLVHQIQTQNGRGGALAGVNRPSQPANFRQSFCLPVALRPLITLVKPEITLMVMISAGVGSLMASDSLQLTVLVHSLVGIGLLAAGASILNQYLERELDGRMRRTARRPLPAGELTARQALVFGVAVSFTGVLYVLLLLNALTALLGLLTLTVYLFVYTPLKTKTPLCTLVGAFPGAAPVLMGWSATTNSLSLEAMALYAILFLWQFPHFYAIGWLYREDYERVGMLMLPSVNENYERIMFRLILIST